MRRGAVAVVLGLLLLVVLVAMGGSSSSDPGAVRAAAVDGTAPPPPSERLLDADAVAAAREGAGCVVRDVPELEDRRHVDEEDAPPEDVLYPALRPTHSGRHFATWLPTGEADDPIATRQLDERQLVHNLEHGAVAAWYDPTVVDAGEVQAWARSRNQIGYRVERAGAALFATPFTDPGLPGGVGVALRAWGVALDCTRWDPLVADGFVAERFGEAGDAPEGDLGGLPRDALRFADDAPTV